MRNLGLVVFVVVVVFLGSGCGEFHTEDEIRSKIDAAIPIGSSKKDVIQFLEKNGFQYIDEPERMPYPPNGKDCEWLPSSLETQGIWGKRYITVDFFFDRRTKTLMELRSNSFYPGSAWP